MPTTTTTDSAPTRVLITGASGFLGQSLIECFHAAGFRVRAFDPTPPSGPALPDEFHPGSATSPESVAAACDGVDALVLAHMAPSQPGVYDTPERPFDINVKGTALFCAEAARRGIRRVVLISSITVVEGHKASGKRILRDAPPLPTSLYGLTKHLQEQILEFHSHAGHFSSVFLRPAYVTDADTLTDKYRRQRPSVNWQFIDRRDVAGAAVAALAPDCKAQGAYFLHGHPAGAAYLEVEPTARELVWTPRFDFTNWPDDAALLPA